MAVTYSIADLKHAFPNNEEDDPIAVDVESDFADLKDSVLVAAKVVLSKSNWEAELAERISAVGVAISAYCAQGNQILRNGKQPDTDLSTFIGNHGCVLTRPKERFNATTYLTDNPQHSVVRITWDHQVAFTVYESSRRKATDPIDKTVHVLDVYECRAGHPKEAVIIDHALVSLSDKCSSISFSYLVRQDSYRTDFLGTDSKTIPDKIRQCIPQSIAHRLALLVKCETDVPKGIQEDATDNQDELVARVFKKCEDMSIEQLLTAGNRKILTVPLVNRS